MCTVLSLAHGLGLVHRDIKPENIVLTPGEGGAFTAKLLDFGIVKALDDETREATRTGTTIGTPSYMSPEQLMGVRVVDGRADLLVARGRGLLVSHRRAAVRRRYLRRRLPFNPQSSRRRPERAPTGFARAPRHVVPQGTQPCPGGALWVRRGDVCGDVAGRCRRIRPMGRSGTSTACRRWSPRRSRTCRRSRRGAGPGGRGC